MRQIKISLTFLISLAIVTSSFAQDAVTVNQGDKAPFTGILMTSQVTDDLRKAVIERDAVKLQNDSLNHIISLQDDNFLHQQNKVTILLEQNDKLAQSLSSSQSMNTWERVAWFAAGLTAALVGAYGIKKAAQ